MIKLVKETITDALNKSGITRIIDIDSNTILIEKPFAVLQFLGETFDKTGFTLTGEMIRDQIKKVSSKYISKLSVSCNIVTQTEEELISTTESFIKNIPSKLRDKNNNMVSVAIVSSTYKLASGKFIGTEKVDVDPYVSRVISLDFSYHITEEQIIERMKKFTITVPNLIKEGVK